MGLGLVKVLFIYEIFFVSYKIGVHFFLDTWLLSRNIVSIIAMPFYKIKKCSMYLLRLYYYVVGSLLDE